jgi:uncharacterized protein (TIGR03086 family)
VCPTRRGRHRRRVPAGRLDNYSGTSSTGPPDKRHAHRGATASPGPAPDHLDQCAGTDPGAAAQSAADSIASLAELFDAGRVVCTPRGKMPLPQLWTVAVIEPVVHAWDLATATGQRVVLDERTVEALLVGAEQLGGQLAATGMYSTAVPVPADAPPLRRLLAALGRRAG